MFDVNEKWFDNQLVQKIEITVCIKILSVFSVNFLYFTRMPVD